MKQIGGSEIMMYYWCPFVLIDINQSWSRSRSRFLLEGSEPEPPKIGRLRNSGTNEQLNGRLMQRFSEDERTYLQRTKNWFIGDDGRTNNVQIVVVAVAVNVVVSWVVSLSSETGYTFSPCGTRGLELGPGFQGWLHFSGAGLRVPSRCSVSLQNQIGNHGVLIPTGTGYNSHL